MSTTGDRQEMLFGYEAPIKRALHERITSYGVPRVWATVWVCFCLYFGLLTMVGLGFRWLLVPAGVWLVGHGALVALTLFDPYWDDMGLAQLQRQYKKFYDAG